jgi:peptidoglycan hydrolase-like protein with peptidoglycan-binding domain
MLRRIFAFSVLFLPLLTFTGGASAATAATAAAAEPHAVSVAVSTSNPVLRLGSRGAAVVRLQKRLTALHYFDVGRIDGVFGPNTYHAVVAFQKVQRIARDGVVGPATWSKLGSPFRPKPRYPLSRSSVEVNLARQVVYYVSDRSIARILDASTGKAATPTPTGRFKIVRRVNGWHESPLGHLYRPNYFYKGYAIHGYTSVPSYPASHGCVRIAIPTMDRMWAALRLGMPVAIYRS